MMYRICFLIIAVHFAFPGLLSARTYGTEQLVKFTESRPKAGSILDKKSEVYRMLARAFSGEYTSVPLVWEPEEPRGNAYAENSPSNDKSRIIIRVSSKLCALDQLAALVYESMNARNEKSFAQLNREAYSGILIKSDFILGLLRLEHKTLIETRAFLTQREPFKGIEFSKTEFFHKLSETPEDFGKFIEYLHRIKRPDFDIFAVYSQLYDFVTMVPRGHNAVRNFRANFAFVQKNAEKGIRQEEE